VLLSTILKALKQIDQTAPPDDLQSWPPRIDTKETVKTRIQKLRLNRKVYVGTLLTLIIVAVAWLAYNHRDLLLAKISSDRISKNDRPATPVPSENGPVYQAKINPPASEQTRGSAADLANNRTGMKDGSKQTQMDKRPGQLPRMSMRQNIEKNPIFTSAGKTETQPKSASSKSGVSPSQRAVHQKTVQSKTRAAVAIPNRKAGTPVRQDSRSYRRLDESKLQLQAIAWSKNAAQRIAVINGHVVREGESVEGFSVTQIRQDDIIVNDGNESWQVEFKLK
jgi:hypothetical protein